MDLAGYHRVTSEGYLADLTTRPVEEIRELRAVCQNVESDLSYLRRLAQGRLDIVDDAIGRVGSGHPPTDLADLVADLPAALAHHIVGPSSGRLTTTLGPGPDPTLTVELDAICGSDQLGRLPSLALGEMTELRSKLATYERAISRRRREVLDRLNALSAELTRRYREGEASVDALLE